MSDEENFEEWIDWYNYHLMEYFDGKTVDHQGLAEDIWSHQQKKLDKANERIKELEDFIEYLDTYGYDGKSIGKFLKQYKEVKEMEKK